MDIEILGKHSLYVTIGDTTFYIDNSTNEQYVSCFDKNSNDNEIHWNVINGKVSL